MALDGFDKAVAAAVIALILGFGFVYTTVQPEEAAVRPVASRVKAEIDPAVYPKLDGARGLMEAGLAGEALAELNGIAKEYPAVSETYALMGETYSRMLDYPAAMRSFRRALTMDPDYADKKSSKYIGGRIESAMKDGMKEAKAALDKDGSDEAAKAALKDAYYIERMLAGGCE
jgi:tetratricopeptide (TPR) repeat protein